MKLTKGRVLVTGAGGFIGSHLTEELVERGCRVAALVHYNSFNRRGWLDYVDPRILAEVEIIAGDVRDPFGVKQAMRGAEVVFHLAALIGIPYSYHSPDVYVDTNVKGTLNVLQAAREIGVARVVHTSTSEIYGTAQWVPISEAHPTNPQSPYAATKSGADFLALTFHRSFGLPVTVLRPFNTYGPRQSARAVIPTIISQILAGKGTRIKLGALGPTRDFTFVLDTVRGFIAAAESDKAVGEIINVGSNQEISVGDLLKKISGLMGVSVKHEPDRVRLRPKKSEVERLWADNTKAKALLKWRPTHSLDAGLRRTIDWFSAPGNLIFTKTDQYTV